MLTQSQITRAAECPIALPLSMDRGMTRRDYITRALSITCPQWCDSSTTPHDRAQLLAAAVQEVDDYIKLRQINQEAITMTTTPAISNQPSALSPQPSAKRPPIPPTVPESKSPALAAVETLTTRVNVLHAETVKDLSALKKATDDHIIHATGGYNELMREIVDVRSRVIKTAEGYTELKREITVLRGMVGNIAEIVQALAATAAQQPASELDAYLGPRATAAGQPPMDWCSIHECKMYHHKDETTGQEWHSHKTPDGTWCRGSKPKGKKS